MKKKYRFLCKESNIFYLAFILLFILNSEIVDAKESRKNPEYILCYQILKIRTNAVKISRKATKDGIIIVMTSSNNRIVEKLQEEISNCASRPKADQKKHSSRVELLSSCGIENNIIYLNNGVYIELKSRQPELRKKIRKVKVRKSFK